VIFLQLACQRALCQTESSVQAYRGRDVAWVTDITYIRTWQGGLYLAIVLDLFSRKVIGWSLKPTLAKEIVLDALVMTVW